RSSVVYLSTADAAPSGHHRKLDTPQPRRRAAPQPSGQPSHREPRKHETARTSRKCSSWSPTCATGNNTRRPCSPPLINGGGTDRTAPRGAVVSDGGERPSISPQSQRRGEAGGSLSRGSRGRAGAASTKSRRPGTAGWAGRGERDGK